MRKFLFLLAIPTLIAVAGPASARPSSASIVEDIYGFVMNTDAGTFDGADLAVAVRAMADAGRESADGRPSVAQAD